MEILELKSPLVVELTLTESCNHKCIHCYNPWREKSVSNRTLSYEQIDYICDELKKNEVQFVTITGGEPTTQYDLLLFVMTKLNKMNIRYAINSNITLLQSEQIVELKRLGISHILTSLPSIYETNFDFITQSKGSYSRFLNNLALFSKNEIDITANMVISQKNINELRELKDFIKRNAIKGLALSIVIPPKYDIENPSYRLSNSDILHIADTLLELKSELGIYVNSLTPLPLCILKDVDKFQRLVSATCCAGITVCTINADGSIYACAHDEKEYGNIFKDGLQKCWKRMNDRRSGDDLNPECKECKLIGLCGGECRMLTSSYHLNNYKLDRNAVIKFSQRDIPHMDLESTYVVNPIVVLREEEFGASINILYENFFITHNMVKLYYLMQKLNKFKLSTILDYVEPNEHFNSTIFYMERVGLIIKTT